MYILHDKTNAIKLIISVTVYIGRRKYYVVHFHLNLSGLFIIVPERNIIP